MKTQDEPILIFDKKKNTLQTGKKVDYFAAFLYRKGDDLNEIPPMATCLASSMKELLETMLKDLNTFNPEANDIVVRKISCYQT